MVGALLRQVSLAVGLMGALSLGGCGLVAGASGPLGLDSHSGKRADSTRFEDAGSTDANSGDVDSGAVDRGVVDAGAAAETDARPADARPADARPADAGAVDAASFAVECPLLYPLDPEPIESSAISDAVAAYAPGSGNRATLAGLFFIDPCTEAYSFETLFSTLMGEDPRRDTYASERVVDETTVGGRLYDHLEVELKQWAGTDRLIGWERQVEVRCPNCTEWEYDLIWVFETGFAIHLSGTIYYDS